ncbi:MAG: helix-turn-helix domain-containing protein [Pseudomonadota bacterium]
MAGRKRPSGRNLKGHLTYTAGELATTLSVHRNTVRSWMREGLEPVCDKRPILFRGDLVKAFLKDFRARGRAPCKPDELFCLRCRAQKRPAGNLVEIDRNRCGAPMLSAICPSCDAMMYRAIAEPDLPSLTRIFDVSERKHTDD